ncbi:pathogenicity island protein [marine actinobacterium PHSC20C1]|nr:pathogenicity island protein [marine actinobacterium PHSC20C1]
MEVLARLEHQGVNVDGDLAAFYPYDPVVMWMGLSREAFDVLARLVAEPEVEVHPTPPMTYLIDGRMLTLPDAKVDSVNKRYPYKKERWLPIVFNKPSR